MHIPDLKIESGYVSVGWLHPDHPFPQGEVPAEFVAKLKQFARLWGKGIDALRWGACGGFHQCEFCGKAWGSGSFGVPATDRLYRAPEMIAHFVEDHGYQPPSAFIAAILAAPVPGTREYEIAVAPFVAPDDQR